MQTEGENRAINRGLDEEAMEKLGARVRRNLGNGVANAVIAVGLVGGPVLVTWAKTKTDKLVGAGLMVAAFVTGVGGEIKRERSERVDLRPKK